MTTDEAFTVLGPYMNDVTVPGSQYVPLLVTRRETEFRQRCYRIPIILIFLQNSFLIKLCGLLTT